MAEVAPPYTEAQLNSDDVSKKDIVVFLQENASLQFLLDHKLKGAVKNVTKSHTKDSVIEAYKELFDSKAFRNEAEDEAKAAAISAEKEKKEMEKIAAGTKKMGIKDDTAEEVPKYTKSILKNGDKKNFPRKGDMVACFYTGRLADGTLFDTNTTKPKKGKPQPLKFKVGQGQVIRGWDEGLQKMSVGEKANLVIEPEWGYGKKGLEGRIPPNATLHFEVELVSIE